MTVVPPKSDPTGGRPVVPTRGALRPLGLREVRVTGGFWGRRQKVNGGATLDHARSWMDKLGWTGNFGEAGKRINSGEAGERDDGTATAEGGLGSVDRRGREFSDSEVYKLLEAMAWEIGRTGDQDRDAELTELTAVVAAAQAPDGYLSTAFGGASQRPRYSDLTSGHELYCTGHLVQAAVARGRTHGPDALVDVARRAADHVCATFGRDGEWGICGHPEIEPALVELARLTGEQRYLDQAALFVERRGHRMLPRHRHGWSYFSDDIPVRDATVLRGHAVRSLYLTNGVVDVAVETGDDELLGIVAGQFDRTLARRTYITGGMGSHHTDEAFGDDFVLPADRAYSETCAGVAAIMLAWRLMLATGQTRYGDVIERLLYNVVATSIADDGRSFFYANTLHQRVPTERVPLDQERLGFGGGPRAPWFEVSCCLPNLARLFASLSTYLVTADRTGLQLHQYAEADVRTSLDDGRRVGLRIQTDYPDDPSVVVRVTETDGGPWAVTLRVPSWATDATVTDAGGRRPAPPGAVVVERDFAVGDEIRLELPMRPRWTFPDPRIDAVRGCVAAELGPVVLCAESSDQDSDDLDALRVDVAAPLETAAHGATGHGYVDVAADRPWPFGSEPGVPDALAAVPVRLVPYHRWARRGPSTMRVWIPQVSSTNLVKPSFAEGEP